MTRSTRVSPDQLTITGTAVRRRRGRAERAVDTSAAAARQRETLEAVHASGVATARQLARALDAAESAGDGYLIAALARELRQLLDGLGWLPGEGGDRDELASFLDALGSPAVGDSAGS